ncbi:hypothetical protein BKA64DRAFT_635604 [Cadophora sp. MPI-SDFR-AT-0126]|nr:hypothetical protein BKA64DRAFT_635604 [Leotiomycetes sp. MPI-SDFR-AT-0126]
MSTDQYPIMKWEKEFARRREIKEQLRILEKKEKDRADLVKGKRKLEQNDEESEHPQSKKPRVNSSNGEQENRTPKPALFPLPLICQSDIPFISIPIIPNFHYGLQQGPPPAADNTHRPLILRLYGAPAPLQQHICPRTIPRTLTRIPNTPPPSNRLKPHAPPGSPFLPADAARDTTTRRFQCAWINCNKDYSTIERANRHIKTTHMKGRNWVCQQCGHFAAKEEESLTDHLRKTGHKDDRWPGFEFWKWV